MQQHLNQQGEQEAYRHRFTHAQMRHYFFKAPVIYQRLLLFGIALCMATFYLSSAYGFSGLSNLSFAVGGICLLWGLVPILVYRSDLPDDQEYSEWVAERSRSLYKIALQRLQIDESQCESIIEIEGGISSLHQLARKFPGKEIVVKRLAKGLRQYSINIAMYMFLLENEIAIYSGYINALSQDERFEDADRYYYHDIVAVSVSGPVYQIRNERSSGLEAITPADTVPVYSEVVATLGAVPVYQEWYASSKQEARMQGILIRISNGDVIGTDYATSILSWKGKRSAQIEGIDKVVAALLALLRDHKESSIAANKISRDLP